MWLDSTLVVFMVLDGNTSYQERIADTIFRCHLKIREVDKEDDLCACHKLTETSATAIQPDWRWHQFMTLPEYLSSQDGRGPRISVATCGVEVTKVRMYKKKVVS